MSNLPTCVQRIDYPIHQGKPNPEHGRFFFVGAIPADCYEAATSTSKHYDTEQQAIDAAIAAGAERIQKCDCTFVALPQAPGRRIDNYPAAKAFMARFENLPKKGGERWKLMDEAKALPLSEESIAAACDYIRMRSDYAVAQTAQGHDPYPYNRPMCDFFGLTPTNDCSPGYYELGCVCDVFFDVEAGKRVDKALAQGAVYRLPIAKSKVTRKPIRFAVFDATSIKRENIETYLLDNGKRKGRASARHLASALEQNLAESQSAA